MCKLRLESTSTCARRQSKAVERFVRCSADIFAMGADKAVQYEKTIKNLAVYSTRDHASHMYEKL